MKKYDILPHNMGEHLNNYQEAYGFYVNGRDALGIEMLDHSAATVLLEILPQEGVYGTFKWIFNRHAEKFGGDKNLAAQETIVDIAVGLACTAKGWLDETTLPLAALLSKIIGSFATELFASNAVLYSTVTDDSGALCPGNETRIHIPSLETGDYGTILPSSTSPTKTTTERGCFGKTVTTEEL